MDFKVEISKILKKNIDELSEQEIMDMLEVPPNPEMGDYSFPCFKLSKIFKKAPQMIASEICEKMIL